MLAGVEDLVETAYRGVQQHVALDAGYTAVELHRLVHCCCLLVLIRSEHRQCQMIICSLVCVL